MTNHFETKAIHSGYEPDSNTLSRAVPIYRTNSYVFNNTEHAANLFSLKELGNIYTRLMNPTQDALEKRIADLEGGAAALALASGTSAIFYSIINICKHGDEVVAASNLYGGTHVQLNNILPQFGINTKFVDVKDLSSFENAINEKTRVIFIETIGNPTLDVADIEGISKIAKKHNLPLVVDSTFTTPYLLNPIEHGANIVIHSLTKWIGGQGTGIGGIVVDAGNFDWTDKKFELFNEPEASYNNLRFAHDLGPLNPVAYILRMRLVPLRNLGACIAPDNAWLFLQGLETLALRMERHCENTLKVSKWLENHPKVSWVKYPGLESDPNFEIANKYLPKGKGSVVVFGHKDGRDGAEKFINNLELFSHVANVGDAKSLAIHPASTTHSQLSQDTQLSSGGLTPDLVRLSIGIEHIDDILADLEQAL